MSEGKILIVADEGRESSNLKHILTNIGYEILYITSNIDDAVEMAIKSGPDLILMDIISIDKDEIPDLTFKIEELHIPLILINSSQIYETEKLNATDLRSYGPKHLKKSELKYEIDLAIYKNKMENKLRESEKKFYLLFKNSPLPYQALDENGNFLDVNPAWLQNLGYTKEEVVGRNFSEFLTQKYSKRSNKTFPHFNATGEISGVEFELRRRDGSIIFVSFECKNVYDEIGTFKQTHCIFQDITEKKVTQERINKLYHLYATLSQINQSIVRIKDREQLFQTICDVCVEYGKFEMAWIGLIDPDTGNIQPVACSGNEEGYLGKINLNINEDPSPKKPTINAIKLGEFCFSENIEQDLDREWSEEALKRNYKSLSSIPLKLNSKVIGILNIYSSKPNFFVEEEIDLVNEMGLDISFALTTIETEQNKKQAEKALKNSEKKYRELVDNSLVGIYKTNLNGEILFANYAMAKMFHYETVEKLKIENMKNLYKNDCDRYQFINELKEKLHITDYELEIIGMDGKTVNVLASANLDGDILSGMFMDITDRKHNDERFSSIIHNSVDLFMIMGRDGLITFHSPSSERILGYSAKHLLGTDPLDYIHPDDIEQVNSHFNKVYETNNIGLTTEFRIRKLNGDYLPVESVSQNMMNIPGIEGIVIASHPIEERKELEKTIYEGEQKYRTLFESDPDYTIVLDLDGIITDVNTAAEKVNYLPSEQLIGKHFSELEIFPEEDLELHKQMFSKLLNDGILDPYESKIIDKDGNLHWVSTVLKIIKEDNLPSYFLVISTDITELKKKEEALKENQRVLETLISNLPGVAYKCLNDPQWTMELVSEGCYELTGYQPEDLIMNKKISYNELIHPDDRQMVWDTIQESLNKKLPFKMIYRLISKDHTHKYVWEQGTGIFSTEGELISLEGFITDVTDTVLNEERLRESETYYRTMFENTGTAAIIIEDDMTISQINTEAEKLSGYLRNEVENKKKWTDFIIDNDIERLKNYFKSRLEPSSTSRKYETKFIDKNRDIKDIFVTIAPIPGTDKELASILDITENKKAEQDLQGSLNEKDILMKEIHHRVKNNMQIVSSLLNLQTKYVDGDESQNVLKESQGRVKTMAMIHEKLYQSNDFTHIKFDEYIERLVSDIFYSYNVKKEQIKTLIHVDEVNLNIETAIPCGLIINELISNCLKYAFPNGRKGEIQLSLKISDDKYELIISDNGVGFPDALDFKHTESLGLQLVNNLVDQIDGEITLDRDNETRFRIVFKELDYKERC